MSRHQRQLQPVRLRKLSIIVSALIVSACSSNQPQQTIPKSVAVTLYAPTTTATSLPLVLRSGLPTATPGPTQVAVAAPAVSAAPVATSVPDLSIDGQRSNLLNLHNQLRATLGLSDYAMPSALQQAAQQQADWLVGQPSDSLANANKAEHLSADGNTLAQYLASTGYNASSTGENWTIAAHSAAAFDFWANNPAHSPSIFSSKFSEIGIGISPLSDGSFVYVVMFATPV